MDKEEKSNLENNETMIQEPSSDKEVNKNKLLNNKRKRRSNKTRNFDKQGLQVIKHELEDDEPIYSITKTKVHKFKTNNFLFIEGRQSQPDQISVSNYFAQRYYYFSLFDKGIKMDEESWYSVTPEEIAIYISKIPKNTNKSTITDAFCGCGGNTIQFSKNFAHVNAVDISKEKIDLCQNNTKVYSCDENISFYNSDYFDFKEKSDYIFLSPPWGGANYKNDNEFTLKKWIYPDIETIISHSLQLSQNLMFYLPRNTDIEELVGLLYKCGKEEIKNNDNTIYLDVQYLHSANKIKAILILYGEEFNSVTVKEIKLYIKEIFHNKNIGNAKMRKLINAAKCLGASKFLKEINIYKETKPNGAIEKLIQNLYNNVMDEDEKKEFIQLNSKKLDNLNLKEKRDGMINNDNENIGEEEGEFSLEQKENYQPSQIWKTLDEVEYNKVKLNIC